MIKNARVVNEGVELEQDVLVQDGRIRRVGRGLISSDAAFIHAHGKILIPGLVDAHVHFRDPGFPLKGTLATESRAAMCGGVTSFLDMPNTVPPVLTSVELQNKYNRAAEQSHANYGFFMGIVPNSEPPHFSADWFGLTDDGLYFDQQSALLVEHPDALLRLLQKAACPVAIHSELEWMVRAEELRVRSIYGEDVPFNLHGEIRSEEACLRATKTALDLAKQTDGRLHVLHVTTAKEAHLFDSLGDIALKKTTAEVCVQNLWFTDYDYERLGALIKWNPSIKTEEDRQGLLRALRDNRLDLIASDHAPHTLAEKGQSYFKAPSGAPMVQHMLYLLEELHQEGEISRTQYVQKACHNPALLYRIKDRGFIREGYWADLVLFDPNQPWCVNKENLYYGCGWSPLEGQHFKAQIQGVWINGHLGFWEGWMNPIPNGMKLEKYWLAR